MVKTQISYLISGVDFTAWQKRLLFDGDEESRRHERKTLIDKADLGVDALGEYLKKHAGIDTEGIGGLLRLGRKWSVKEAKSPPAELETATWETWKKQGVHLALAQQPAYWYGVFITAAREKNIEGNLLDILASTSKSELSEDCERETRDILRHMGGIPVVRGPSSVMSDCPMSSLFWRGHFSQKASEHSEGEIEEKAVHVFLHNNPTIWRNLVEISTKQVTAIARPKVFSSVVQILLQNAPDSAHAKHSKDFIRKVATRFVHFQPHLMGYSEVLSIVGDEYAYFSSEVSKKVALADQCSPN